jgi:predicted pyridoxine 5'-phosphate oxidase superfamily flavin-nucleotide-binding protein
MTASPFHTGETDAQLRWGNPALWTEVRVKQLIWDHIPEQFHGRIEAAPFFFLASSHPDGRCDCSFKGGGPGLVKVFGTTRIAFPHFEPRVKGNGAYMSLGNILLNPHVSLLFIDFSDGARLRVNGKASLHENAEMMQRFPQAECVVAVDIELVAPSCPAYIPRLIPAEPLAAIHK